MLNEISRRLSLHWSIRFSDSVGELPSELDRHPAIMSAERKRASLDSRHCIDPISESKPFDLAQDKGNLEDLSIVHNPSKMNKSKVKTSYLQKLVLLLFVLAALSGVSLAQSPYPQATVRPARHSAPNKAPALGIQPANRIQHQETHPMQSRLSVQRFPSRSRPPVAPSSYPKATPREESVSGRSRALQAAPKDEFRHQNHSGDWGYDDHYYDDDYAYDEDWEYQDDQPWGRGYYDDFYYDDEQYYQDEAYHGDEPYFDEPYYGEPYYQNNSDSQYRGSSGSQYRGHSGAQYRNTRPKRKQGGLPRKSVEFTW